MKKKINRRDFVTTGAAAGVAVATGRSALAAASSEHNVLSPALSRSPEMLSTQGTTPMVISDYSGFGYRNGGTMNAVEKAFQMITEGEDVLDAVNNKNKKLNRDDDRDPTKEHGSPEVVEVGEANTLAKSLRAPGEGRSCGDVGGKHRSEEE